MVFSSLEFIFIFLPIFFTVYYSVPKRFRNIVLLIGSLCFYIIGSIKHPFHIALLMSGIIADFAAGLLIEKRKAHRRLFLVLGILFHLICLCLFKYSAFITDELSRHIKSFNFSLDFVLPIGISFYTFQGISYIADIYNQKLFTSTYTEIKGVGTNETKASLNAIKRLNKQNSKIGDFMINSKRKIIEYYNLKKADRLVKNNKDNSYWN